VIEMRIVSIAVTWLLISIFSLAIIACENASQYETSDRSKVFYIKAFSGLIEFPAGLYFDTRSIAEDYILFSNLGAHDAHLAEEPNVVIRVGGLDESTLKSIDMADVKTECYGFKQAIQTIKSETGRYTSAVFYDEKMYVSIMSDNVKLWVDSLVTFRKSHNDLEGKCLKLD
jgi:hypothetical protein